MWGAVGCRFTLCDMGIERQRGKKGLFDYCGWVVRFKINWRLCWSLRWRASFLFSSLLTSSASHFCVSSYSHINLWSSSPLLSLSSFVLLFLSPPPPIPLSASSSPPYLTGCHSNSVCQWLNIVYLLFLSSLLLDEHCFCIMCAWGIDERGKKWRKGSFNHRSGGPATTLILLVLFSLFLQVNLSPFPFFRVALPLQLNLCMECVHAGEQVLLGFLAAMKLVEVWTMGWDE